MQAAAEVPAEVPAKAEDQARPVVAGSAEGLYTLLAEGWDY